MRNYLDEKGIISIQITGSSEVTAPFMSYYEPYKCGVVQAGVLCVKPDASVLYAWTVTPSEVSDPQLKF